MVFDDVVIEKMDGPDIEFKNWLTRERILSLGAIVIFWLFIALIFTPQTYLLNQNSPTPLSWPRAFSANVVLFLAWALLTPFGLWLGRIFPLERHRFLIHFIYLFVLGLVFAAGHILLVYLANYLFLAWAGSYRPPVPVVALLVGIGATNLLIYWGIIAVSQAILYFRRYRERELRLAEAQLEALKTQLHPHFLFNTLNAIAELTYDAPETADQTLTKLSDLLRLSLESGKAQEVSLKDELDFLQKYLEIQKILLDERLTVIYEIEPHAFPASVPNMILQPLAENSIRHGIAPRERGGRIAIRARKTGENLLLEIEDDGIGIDRESGRFREGLGLANTRQRLNHLYGGAHRFDLGESAAGGVKVEITLPYQEHHGEKDENTHFDS